MRRSVAGLGFDLDPGSTWKWVDLRIHLGATQVHVSALIQHESSLMLILLDWQSLRLYLNQWVVATRNQMVSEIVMGSASLQPMEQDRPVKI